MDLVEKAKEHNETEERDIRKLHKKLADAKEQLKGLQKRYAESEDELATAKQVIQLFTATRGEFDDKPLTYPKRTKDAHGTAMISVADWHSEEHVDPKTINHENAFNLDIAERRIDKLWDKALLLIENVRELTRIDDLLLSIYGDLIGGHIHEELAESNFLSPLQATRWVQNKVYDGVRRLKDKGKFKRIRVACVSGNHARDTPKKRIATRERHSYEWFAYHNVADRFENDPIVQFQIADGVLNYITVENRLLRITHGDAIQFGGGVGGLAVPASRKIHKWDQTRKAYRTYFGHWHQYIQTSNFTAVPTLKGYDAFSEWIGASKEEPAQLLSVFDSHRGLTREEKIFVE